MLHYQTTHRLRLREVIIWYEKDNLQNGMRKKIKTIEKVVSNE